MIAMNSHADEDLDHLQKLIDVSTKHLHELELTAAKFGEDGPAHIKISIANERQALDVLHERWRAATELCDKRQQAATHAAALTPAAPPHSLPPVDASSARPQSADDVAA
jgi:hypothetical protein